MGLVISRDIPGWRFCDIHDLFQGCLEARMHETRLTFDDWLGCTNVSLIYETEVSFPNMRTR